MQFFQKSQGYTRIGAQFIPSSNWCKLSVEKASESDHLADYLDLTFIIDSGDKLSTRLYDKRDDFDFHIVNFPFLSSNIPSGPSYGVCIQSLLDMHNDTHTMTISDITTSV